MRGLSALIAVILLMMIAVVLTGLTVLWASNTLPTVTETVGESYNATYLRSRACLSIDSINSTSGRMVVRNCGLVPLHDFHLSINSNEVSFSPAISVLDPHVTAVLGFNPVASPAVYNVVADLAESPFIRA